jgi:hypothetical protein
MTMSAACDQTSGAAADRRSLPGRGLLQFALTKCSGLMPAGPDRRISLEVGETQLPEQIPAGKNTDG